MKLSKKYLKKQKKKLLSSMFSIATVLMLIAGSKLAGLFEPIDIFKGFSTNNVTDETIVGTSASTERKWKRCRGVLWASDKSIQHRSSR